MTLSAKLLAATPPMGWNSWNMFGDAIHEDLIRETAEALVVSGLKECGYHYIVIDDGWSRKSGRGQDGNLVADPDKFPNGLQALADYVHNLGFKFGLYSDAAELTCGGYVGSYGLEAQDAQLWAAWNVDFLKYDYCHAPTDQATAIERYTRMGRALSETGREFLFSICEWGGRSPHVWGRQVGGHMWRVSGDVIDRWSDIDAAVDIAAHLYTYGGPGGWNDLDMLVVGLQGKGQVPGSGMSFAEYQTHMSVWCLACSPLMIGCDVRRLDQESVTLLMNREVLAVNQDVAGRPAQRVRQYGDGEVWQKPLSDGTVAVALINRGSTEREITVRAGDLGLLDEPKLVRDLWAQQDIADFTQELTQRVLPHGTMLLKIKP